MPVSNQQLDEFGIPIKSAQPEMDEFGIPIKKKGSGSTGQPTLGSLSGLPGPATSGKPSPKIQKAPSYFEMESRLSFEAPQVGPLPKQVNYGNLEAALYNAKKANDDLYGASKIAKSPASARGMGPDITKSELDKVQSRYNSAMSVKDRALKESADQVYKPIDDLLKGDGYKKFFTAGVFDRSKAMPVIDEIVNPSGGGTYVKTTMLAEMQKRANELNDKPEFEGYLKESFQKNGIDMNKYGQEMFDKMAQPKLSNLNQLKQDAESQAQNELLNSKGVANQRMSQFQTVVDGLNAQIRSGEITQDQANQAYEQQKTILQRDLKAIDIDYQNKIRNINVSINRRYSRIEKELKDIERSVTDQGIWELLPDAEKSKIQKAYSEAAAKLNTRKNETRKAVDESLGIVNMAARGISSGFLSALSQIGGYLNMHGYDNSFTRWLNDKETVAQMGAPAQYEWNGSEWLNRAVASSAQSLGASVPAMVPAIIAGAATAGAGLPAIAGAITSGIAAYQAESMQLTGDVYNKKLEETGDPVRAAQSASRFKENIEVTMPLYFIGGLGTMKLLKGGSVARALTGTGLEMAEEIPVEYVQSFSEAKENGYTGTLKSFIKENPEIALDTFVGTIGQSAAMSAAGSTISALGKSIGSVDKVLPNAESQHLSDALVNKGPEFAHQLLRKYYDTGVIGKKEYEKMKVRIDNMANMNSMLASASPDSKMAVISISDTIKSLQSEYESEQDPTAKSIIKTKIDDLNKKVLGIVQNKEPFIVLELPGGVGARRVMTVDEYNELKQSGQADNVIMNTDSVRAVNDDNLNSELQETKKRVGFPAGLPDGSIKNEAYATQESGQEQGVVPQSGVVQPERAQEGQPEVGQGAGGIGQATVSQADAGDRAVSGTGGIEVVTADQVEVSSDATDFEQQMTSARASLGSAGLSVTPYRQQEYDEIANQGGKFLRAIGNKVLSLLKPNGEIVSVVKDATVKARGAAQAMISKMKDMGGLFMDNYDIYLTDIYKKAGYRVVARVPFDEQYAPQGWDAEDSPLKNRPDVVFMVREDLAPQQERSFGSYEEAQNYTNGIINDAVNSGKAKLPAQIESERAATGTEVSGQPAAAQPSTAQPAATQPSEQPAAAQPTAQPAAAMEQELREELGMTPEARGAISRTVAKFVSTATRSLRSFGVKFIVVENDQDAAAQGLTSGQAMFDSGNGVIIINKARLADELDAGIVVWHEASHPIMNAIRNTDRELYDRFVRGMKEAAAMNAGVAGAVKWANDQPQYETQEEKDDEAGVETLGRISAGVVDLNNIPTSFKQALVELINKISKMLGMGSVLSDTSDLAAFKRLATEISKTLTKGADAAGIVGRENVAEFGADEVQMRANDVFDGILQKIGIDVGKVNPKTGRRKVTNLDVAKAMNQYYKKLFKSIRVGDFGKKALDIVSDYASDEVIFATQKFGNNSGQGWYTVDYARALDIMKMFDADIVDNPDIKEVATIAIAVASNSTDVYTNLSRIIYAVSQFKKTGKIPTDIGVGKGASSIASSVKVYNNLLDLFGSVQDLKEFMQTVRTVGESKKALIEKSGLGSWAQVMEAGLGTDPEWNDSEVLPTSVVIFGPKIGAFWSNLSGLGGTPTIDRWCIRTMYRYLGDMRAKVLPSEINDFMSINGLEGQSKGSVMALIESHSKLFDAILDGRGEYKGLTKEQRNEKLKPYRKGSTIWKKLNGIVNEIEDGITEKISNKSQYAKDFRSFTKRAFEEVQRKVKEKTGQDLEISDIQAILWIYEKELFGAIGVKQKPESTYSASAQRLVNEMEAGKFTLSQMRNGGFSEESDVVEDGAMGDLYGTSVEKFEIGLKEQKSRLKSPAGRKKQASVGNRNLVTEAKLDKFMTEDGEGNYLFFHYSGNRFTKLDPNRFGSNLVTGRGEQPGVGLSMMYTEPGTIESGVPSQFGYAVRVPMEKVYPFNQDPLDLYDEAEAEFRKVYGQQVAFDPNKQVGFISQVAAKKGYPVTVAEWYIGGRKVLRAQTTEKLPVEKYKTTDRNVEKVEPKFQGIQSNRKKQRSVGGRDLVSNREIINGFYSPIEDRIKTFKQPKASVQKWREIVGVKSDESVFSGMSDWLGAMKPDRQLSKEEVLQFMTDNRIEIKEVVKDDVSSLGLTMSGWSVSGKDTEGRNVYRQKEYTIRNSFFGDKFSLVYEDGSIFGKPIGDYDSLTEAKEAANETNLTLRKATPGTKFSEYQLPGGKNYKEILITLPQKTEKTRFKSKHFDEPNIIAHLRMNTRTDLDGKRVLFLEEIQSDWGQAGKSRGFKTGDIEIQKRYDEAQRKSKEAEGVLNKEMRRYRETYPMSSISSAKESGDQGVINAYDNYTAYEEERLGLLDDVRKATEGIEKAPYVTNTSSWVKLGLKVALKEAVQQGADRISWTTGQQQNERYDLSKSVDSIKYSKRDGVYSIFAGKGSSILYDRNDVSESELPGIVGKEIADKIIAGEGRPGTLFERGTTILSGDDLKIGGSGMRSFYGDAKTPGIVANVAKALVKELTGREGQIVESRISAPVNQDVIDRYNRARQYGNVPESLAKEYEQASGLQGEQPAIDITKDLAASVQSGIPQFSVGRRNLDRIISDSKAAGTYLKAPNGNPTNLTESQWATVRTPEFKNWFGDWENDPANASKVVDENGEPMVVYHGTTSGGFDVFNMGKIPDEEWDDIGTSSYRSGADATAFLGSHFAKERSVAEMFTSKIYEHQGGNPKMYESFLNIRNTYSVDESKLQDDLQKQNLWDHWAMDRYVENSDSFYELDPDEMENKYKNNIEFRKNINQDVLGQESSDALSFADYMAEEYRDGLIKDGFDGIQYKNMVEGGTSYIVFNPNQIKSATANIGAFSTTDPRIQMSVGGRTENDVNFKLAAFVMRKKGEGAGTTELVTSIASVMPSMSPQEIKDLIDDPEGWLKSKYPGMTPEQHSNLIERAKRMNIYRGRKFGAPIDPAFTGLQIPQDKVDEYLRNNKRRDNAAKELFKKYFNKAYFTSSRGLPDWFLQVRDLAAGAKNIEIDRAAKTIERLRRTAKSIEFSDWDAFSEALKDAYETNPIATAGPGMPAVFTGAGAPPMAGAPTTIPASVSKLPAEIIPFVYQMRGQIDNLTRDLIGFGFVTPEQAINLQSNIGAYVNRSYRLFTEKDYQPSTEVYNAAVKYLADQKVKEIASQKVGGITYEEAMEEAIREATTQVEAIKNRKTNPYFRPTSIDKRNPGILKQRQEIPEPLRKLMGEYTDPGMVFMMTVSKQAALKSSSQYLSELRKMGIGTIFFEANDTNRPITHNVEVAAEGSETLAPLGGLYTTQEIYDALTSMEHTYNNLTQVWMKAVGVVRWLKTVGSVATQFKNFESNLGFAVMNGLLMSGSTGEAFKAAGQYVKSQYSMTESNEIADKAIKLNLVGQAIGARELAEMIGSGDVHDVALDIAIGPEGKWGKRVTKRLNPIRFANKLYRMSDDFWKVYAYINERELVARGRFGGAYDTLTEDQQMQVDAESSERVKNTWPTYDRVIEAAKALSKRAPIFGNFISFQAESIRVLTNTIKLAAQDIKDPQMRSSGVRRMVGIATYASLRTAITISAAQMFGFAASGLLGAALGDDDEERRKAAIKEALPPFMRSGDLLIKPGSAPHKFTVVNMSDLDPYGIIPRSLNALTEGREGIFGRTMEPGMMAAISEFFSPFLEQEMTFSTISSIWNNMNSQTGEAIVGENDSPQDALVKIGEYMWKQLKPSTAGIVERIYKGGSAQTEGLALFGARPYEVDLHQAWDFALNRMTAELGQVRSEYNDKSDAKKFTAEEIEEARLKAEAKTTKIINRYNEVYKNFILTGANPEVLNEKIESRSPVRMTGFDNTVKGALKTNKIEGPIFKKKEEEDEGYKPE